MGPLFEPEKSIFLFDPLLLLAIVMLVLLWKRLAPGVRAYAVATLVLLVAYISFYARYFAWAGDLPGATAMFRPRWSWRRCWRYRCCCDTART